MVIIILGTFFVPKESNDVYAVESPKDAILYKDNGNYYIVCTQDNTEYEEIQRDREYYFRIHLDCELIDRSIFTFYVTDEYGQRKDSFTFACRDDNYDFNHKMDMAYIPISSLINRQQGKFKIYYKVAMSNGSLLRKRILFEFISRI